MTAFATLDPRVPNDKRKQLVAKLMQQATAPHAGAPLPSVPPTEGRSFRNATDVRRTGVQPITQAPNVLSSVLSKLGVTGRSLSNEISPGYGLPIQIAGPLGHVGIDPREVAQGQATSMPVAPSPGVVPPTVDPTSSQPSAVYGGRPNLPPMALGGSNDVGPVTPTPTAGAYVSDDPHPGLVPLGNGHYYDPVMDRILGHGAVAEGQAARGR